MRDSAKDILGFHFNPSYYEGLAKHTLKNNIVSQNIKIVMDATDALECSAGTASECDIKRIIDALTKAYDEHIPAEKVVISRRDARSLSYNLLSAWSLKFLKFCLLVLEVHWSSTMLRGLMHGIMSQWDTLDPDAKKALLDTFQRHVDTDSSRCATQLRPLKEYINEPYKIGRTLWYDSKPVLDCCAMFNIPRNRFSYPFFTSAIIGYYEVYRQINIEELKQVLLAHNNTKADKILIPRLLIHMNEDAQSPIPQEWVELAIERIGDPSIESNWAPFPLATREEQVNLEKARLIVLRVISSQFVRVFFETLCLDGVRLAFWLKHVDKIKDFTVYGTVYSKSYIQPFVNDVLLTRHFYTVQTNTSNSALVMNMGNYALVEFTEMGALYAYKVGTPEFNDVFVSGKINTLADLKRPSVNNLIINEGNYIRFRDYGRMVHTGSWQYRLENWISRKI